MIKTTQEAYSKSGKSELIAIMVSGFYIFASLVVQDKNISTYLFLKPLFVFIKDNPISIAFIVIFSYLFGSIVRSLPVSWAEYITPPFKNEFPYTNYLKESLDSIKKHSKDYHMNPDLLPEIQDSLKDDTFKYWKVSLCLRSPSLFDYTQLFEGRVRFFVGMWWSGIIGSISGICMLFITNNIYLSPALSILMLSIFLTLIFGFQIRRVRKDEAKIVAISYIALEQQRTDKTV